MDQLQIDDRDSSGAMALCVSCDRCRSRKTKCDGKRPCGNCASKYMKKNKLNSIEGIPVDEFECVYSPARRRGPIPGKTGKEKNKTHPTSPTPGNQSVELYALQQQAAAATSMAMDAGQLAAFLNGGANGVNTIQQQLNFLQQQQMPEPPSQQRVRLDPSLPSSSSSQGVPTIPKTILSHTHLLERSDSEGNRLRSYYRISVDEIFRLPVTPTDEEYCKVLDVPGVTPGMIPGSHLAALSAVRFAEVAIGAIVHNEVGLAMELCNAVVHCLRESVQEPVEKPIMFEVAKAYFLLGVFRACRGDMARYFKYRRVCLKYLSKLDGNDKTNTLLAAVSYLDAWAYMMYNANEEEIPDVDGFIPSSQGGCKPCLSPDPNESKYGVRSDPFSIANDPKNKNWIQGAPPVYLNNEAPLPARILDALSCAIRTCCDQANSRFCSILQQNGNQLGCSIPPMVSSTPTATAVLAHENELCSRNMVLSAYTLMQSHQASQKQSGNDGSNEGLNLVISAMDAFLENSDENVEGGFSDSQIQSLLSVCNTAVENPFLLHHAGPTYHMVSNAAILLCHLLNGLDAMKGTDQFGAMEATLFDEVVDTFISIRKLLTIHRRKLPVKLRCHGIPRPTFEGLSRDQPFIDLGETLLCPCRGCQGFVLMACSPCVAAERAMRAEQRLDTAAAQEAEAMDMGELPKGDFGDFDLDDDVLLNMIGNLITNS